MELDRVRANWPAARPYFCEGNTGKSSARTPMVPTIRQKRMIFSIDVPPDLIPIRCDRGKRCYEIWRYGGKASPKFDALPVSQSPPTSGRVIAFFAAVHLVRSWYFPDIASCSGMSAAGES